MSQFISDSSFIFTSFLLVTLVLCSRPVQYLNTNHFTFSLLFGYKIKLKKYFWDIKIISETSKYLMSQCLNGSCACIIRLSKVTVEVLNYYVFGTLNGFKGNWENLKRFGVAELLLKIWGIGKRYFWELHQELNF